MTHLMNNKHASSHDVSITLRFPPRDADAERYAERLERFIDTHHPDATCILHMHCATIYTNDALALMYELADNDLIPSRPVS